MANPTRAPKTKPAGWQWNFRSTLGLAVELMKFQICIVAAYGTTHLLYEWGVIGEGALAYALVAAVGVYLLAWFVSAPPTGRGVTIHMPDLPAPRRRKTRKAAAGRRPAGTAARDQRE